MFLRVFLIISFSLLSYCQQQQRNVPPQRPEELTNAQLTLESVNVAQSSSISGRTNLFNSELGSASGGGGQIIYRPQTPVEFNDGQEKTGNCPATRPTTNGYSSFRQYEGIWFKRFRSRVRVGEPFFKCAWIDYVLRPDGREMDISDNLLNNVTNEWFRQDATSTVWENDQAMWSSLMPSGALFNTHLLYYDEPLGVALIYSCRNTDKGHSDIANVYTRRPDTPLSNSFIEFLQDVLYQNGIYDVQPLHFVDQSNCTMEELPTPRSGPPLSDLKQ